MQLLSINAAVRRRRTTEEIAPHHAVVAPVGKKGLADPAQVVGRLIFDRDAGTDAGMDEQEVTNLAAFSLQKTLVSSGRRFGIVPLADVIEQIAHGHSIL